MDRILEVLAGCWDLSIQSFLDLLGIWKAIGCLLRCFTWTHNLLVHSSSLCRPTIIQKESLVS